MPSGDLICRICGKWMSNCVHMDNLAVITHDFFEPSFVTTPATTEISSLKTLYCIKCLKDWRFCKCDSCNDNTNKIAYDLYIKNQISTKTLFELSGLSYEQELLKMQIEQERDVLFKSLNDGFYTDFLKSRWISDEIKNLLLFMD